MRVAYSLHAQAHFKNKCDDFVLARQLEMQDTLTAIQTEPAPVAAASAQPWRPPAPAATAPPPQYGSTAMAAAPPPYHQAAAGAQMQAAYGSMHAQAQVPPGYSTMVGPNGVVYAVPTHQAQQAQQQWGSQPPAYQPPPPAYNPYRQ